MFDGKSMLKPKGLAELQEPFVPLNMEQLGLPVTLGQKDVYMHSWPDAACGLAAEPGQFAVGPPPLMKFAAGAAGALASLIGNETDPQISFPTAAATVPTAKFPISVCPLSNVVN